MAPDEATYPKAFQNTIVAFLIFSGIYLMLSLTASILREQVSSRTKPRNMSKSETSPSAMIGR